VLCRDCVEQGTLYDHFAKRAVTPRKALSLSRKLTLSLVPFRRIRNARSQFDRGFRPALLIDLWP
jgi:lauroyl/myristoyl acyltransferase